MMYTYLYSRTKRTLLRCKNSRRKRALAYVYWGKCIQKFTWQRSIQWDLAFWGTKNEHNHSRVFRKTEILFVCFAHSLTQFTHTGQLITMCVSRELADEFRVTSIYWTFFEFWKNLKEVSSGTESLYIILKQCMCLIVTAVQMRLPSRCLCEWACIFVSSAHIIYIFFLILFCSCSLVVFQNSLSIIRAPKF